MIEISVIVPCFNCEEWIERCLDSMQKQTFPHEKFEVICVDDCSSDNTVLLIETLKEKYDFYLVLIKLSQNMGPGKARNTAIKSAIGEWLTFCDSDDWYENTFLTDMYTAVKESGSDIAMCEYRKVFKSQRKEKKVCYLADVRPNATQEEMIVNSKASLGLLILRRDLFMGWELPDLRNGEDLAFVPCVEAIAKSICTVRKVLYNYYIRSSSISNTVNEGVYQSLLASFAYIESHFGDKYPRALEIIGVRVVLYGALLNALKRPHTLKIGKDIVTEFEKKYPMWWNNEYIKTFSKPKRLFLWAVKTKNIWLCRTIACVHIRLSV